MALTGLSKHVDSKCVARATQRTSRPLPQQSQALVAPQEVRSKKSEPGPHEWPSEGQASASCSVRSCPGVRVPDRLPEAAGESASAFLRRLAAASGPLLFSRRLLALHGSAGFNLSHYTWNCMDFVTHHVYAEGYGLNLTHHMCMQRICWYAAAAQRAKWQTQGLERCAAGMAEPSTPIQTATQVCKTCACKLLLQAIYDRFGRHVCKGCF